MGACNRMQLARIAVAVLVWNIGLYFIIQENLLFRQTNSRFPNSNVNKVLAYVTDSNYDMQHIRHLSLDNKTVLTKLNSSQAIKRNPFQLAIKRNPFHSENYSTPFHGNISSNKLLQNKKPSNYTYVVTAVILVRIYKYDKPKWSTKELGQWIRYMQYAGVGHVYLYDNYKFLNESLKNWTGSYFASKEVTYHDWSKYMPYSISGTQETAYFDALKKYGKLSKFQIAMDMDEYPYAPNDMERNFLIRFIEKQTALSPDIAEFSFKNFLYLGKPKDQELVIERMIRRTPKPANALDKPMYKTKCVSKTRVHHNSLKCGRSWDVTPEVMRMNHYWGARLQNWGDDTPKILNRTMEDNSTLIIADLFKKAMGESIHFS